MTSDELQALLADANTRYAAEVDDANHNLASAQMQFARDYEAAQQRLTEAILNAQHNYSQSVLADKPLGPRIGGDVTASPPTETSPTVTTSSVSTDVPGAATGISSAELTELFEQVFGKSRPDSLPAAPRVRGKAVSEAELD